MHVPWLYPALTPIEGLGKPSGPQYTAPGPGAKGLRSYLHSERSPPAW